MIGVENGKQQMEDTGHGVRVSLSTDGNTSGRMEGLMMLGTGSGVGWGASVQLLHSEGHSASAELPLHSNVALSSSLPPGRSGPVVPLLQGSQASSLPPLLLPSTQTSFLNLSAHFPATACTLFEEVKCLELRQSIGS